MTTLDKPLASASEIAEHYGRRLLKDRKGK